MRTALPLLAAVTLAACGSSPPGARRAQAHLDHGDYDAAEKEADGELARFPRHPTLWRIKVQAAMGRGDNAAGVGHYARWKHLRGADDAQLLRLMAITVLWQGLRVPSAELNVTAIQIVERHELEVLANDVIERMGHDDDVVAAAAAVAVLRAHPSAGDIAGELLRSSEPRARAIVIEGIGRKIGKLARADLIDGLADKDESVRLAAVNAVGALADDRDTARLSVMARADGSGPVRARALAALGRGERRRDESFLPLVRIGLADAYLGARLAAVELAATAAGSGGRPLLVEAAAGDDLFVALRAAAALRRQGGGGQDQQVPAGLIQRALASDVWNVRVAAAAAVPDLVEAGAAVALLAPVAVDDPIVEVRIAAARSLIRAGSQDQALPILVAAAEYAKQDGPRLSAAIELLRLGDPHGLATLTTLSRSASPATRRGAAGAIRHSTRPTDALVSALADETADVRLEAAETLLYLTK